MRDEHAHVLGSIKTGDQAGEARQRMLARSMIYEAGDYRCGARVGSNHQPMLHLGDYLELEAQPAGPTLFRGEFPGWEDALGNNWLSDCGPAMVMHGIEAYQQFAGAPITPFTTEDCQLLYSQCSGYVIGNGNTDRGCYTADIAKRMTVGGGARCAADKSAHTWITTIALDPYNVVQNMIALAEFVVVYREIALPRTAQGQTAWKVIGDGKTGASAPGSWDYHFVPYIGFGPGYWDCDSWGQLIPVDETFDLAYAYRGAGGSWVALSPDMLKRTGISPLGINYDRLTADIHKLGAGR